MLHVRTRHRSKDNIKMNLKEIGSDLVDWTLLAPVLVRLRVFVEHGNETSGSHEGRGSDCVPLQKACAE
jgi:hypothetical protein